MARTELSNGVILPAEYSDDWYEDMTSNLTKLDDVIGSDSEKLNSNDVAFLRMSSAALTDGGTGNFSDLNSSNKLKTGDYVLDSGRKLYQVVSVDSTNETFTVGNSLFKITAESDLAPVAESGDYDDLDNKPDLNPYDQHLANTVIHVTTADKSKWNNGVSQAYVFRYSSTALVASSTNSNTLLDNTDNLKVGDKVIDSDGVLFSITAIDTANSTFTIGSALIDLAKDSDVVHNTGNETVGGIKTFSDDTFVKSLNNTREVASPSASSTVILPIVATMTFTDQSPSQSAILNLRISADGSKTLYPNENGLYSLGLVSRNWDNIFSYMFESLGKNLGNEFSGNARTNLYLKANRDTADQSGVYISKFRQNRAQGEMGTLDAVQVTFDVLENSVRTNRTWYLNYINWENDVPKTVEIRSSCEKVDYKLTRINDLNPGCLSLPNLNSGIDISGYLDVSQASINTYTPPSDGYISIFGRGSVTNGIVIKTGSLFANMGQSVLDFDSTDRVSFCMCPVFKNQTVTIWLKSVTSLDSAKFFPCLGNV